MGDTTNGGAAGDRIRHFIDRAWNLEEEKATIMGEFREDLKTVYDEAAAEGFNAQALKEVIALKKKARKRGQSFIDDYDLYRHAAGLEGTPLDMARERREREEAEQAAAPPEPGRTVAVVPNRETVEGEIIEPEQPSKRRLASPPKRLAGPGIH